jgi:hypothetical protein
MERLQRDESRHLAYGVLRLRDERNAMSPARRETFDAETARWRARLDRLFLRLPLLVVLRCVPCLACAGIDARVLDREGDLTPLLDRFVCVRLINANDLDLARFQFDYDLSFSTLFFNADGTVYGRYGSWKHQKNSQESATEGLKKAMVAALDLHKGYPANKAALAGKQPGEMPFKTPVEIPQLAENTRRTWIGRARSCRAASTAT